ncbi:MAG: hypothetical protein HYR63_24455 [Proteobacteria bacterium]|nr:hypothetical protein [Pseudomonadota bacterium]
MLRRHGRPGAAAAAYARQFAIDPADIGARTSHADTLRLGNNRDAALRYYRRSLTLAGAHQHAGEGLAQTYWEQGCGAQARVWYGRALATDPADPRARLGACIAQIPIAYAREEEIEEAREAYARKLRALVTWSNAADTSELARFAAAVGTIQPFFLAYQNQDDCALQRSYGAVMCRTLAARYPDLAMPPPPAQEPVGRHRIGIVTGYFRSHSVWKMAISGWLSELDRQRFALFGYHTGTVEDRITDSVRRNLDGFVDDIHDREALARRIRADRLDVVLFPEIGIDPVVAWLAGLRLAPVQAMSWGHPTTSGYPTIDYFLSSELMEPADADRFYTERLVRLPGLGCHYRRMTQRPADLRRTDIGAETDDVIYLCAQSLFKYLPREDELLVRIADAVPRARFVFFSGGLPNVTRTVADRLARRLAAAGHDAAHRLIFLPMLTEAGFMGVGRLADVLLDSVGWSGFNTTVEIIDAGIPVVCLEGLYMRGRHTAAALRFIGLDDMIALDRTEYLRRAICLGLDVDHRRSEGSRLRDAMPHLFGDVRPIRALEAFLLQTCQCPAS